jgi:hypothetical protein
MCRSYIKGKCPGCAGNNKVSWCTVRTCCLQKTYDSCAECVDFPDPGKCEKFNNFFSRVFGLLFNSDRRSCIMRIKVHGIGPYAAAMARAGRQSLKKNEPLPE